MNANFFSTNNDCSETNGGTDPLRSRLPILRACELCLPTEKKLGQEVCQLADFARTQVANTNKEPDTDIGFSLKQQVIAVPLKELNHKVEQRVSAMLKRFEVDIGNIIIHLIPEHNYNGFAAYNRFDGSFVIGVNSRLLDDFSPEQLAFVVGHECGHVMLKHPKILQILAGLTLQEGHVLQLTYPALSRRQEIAADRIGMLCCGDLGNSLATIRQTAVQAKATCLEAGQHSPQAYAFYDQEFDGYAPWLQSHPSMTIRFKALHAFESVARQIGSPLPVNLSELSVVNEQCEKLAATMDHDSQKSLADKRKYSLVLATIEHHFLPHRESEKMQPLLAKEAAVSWLNRAASPGRRLRILDYLISRTWGCSKRARLQSRLEILAKELMVGLVFQKRLAGQRSRFETVLGQIIAGEKQ